MQQESVSSFGLKPSSYHVAAENIRDRCHDIPLKGAEIPEFPIFKALEINDRSILQSYFLRLQPEISDRCFTNLFLWQDFYDIRISRFKENICILCASSTTPEKEFFFPPLGENDVLECIDICFDYMRSHNIKPIIRRASENFVSKYIIPTDIYIAKENLCISDYIYRTEDMINLKGRRYHGQRNYIKRFKKMFPNYHTEFIDQHNIPECICFNDQWLEKKLAGHADLTSEEMVFLKAEVDTARKILLNFDRLHLCGLAIRINGIICAFTVGEKLNDRMALIHIEKCDHSYIGLNQLLTQTFCQQAWNDCEYVNRMEDLGIEGLRKAKLALGPHHIAKKYDIIPKK